MAGSVPSAVYLQGQLSSTYGTKSTDLINLLSAGTEMNWGTEETSFLYFKLTLKVENYHKETATLIDKYQNNSKLL